MDWGTLACGQGGHLTFAPDEPELADQLRARLADGPAWQCLRCGAYVRGPATLSGPAATAPVVPRGKEIRSRFILRLFAIERLLRAIAAVTAAVFLWQFRHSQTSIEQKFDRELPVIRGLFRQLGYNINSSKLVGLLHHALTLSSKTLTLLAIGLALYAIIEIVEAVGLWLARRWGEYFAMVATSLGLPLEIYDLAKRVTATALVLFAINLALVLYLVITKRLFGVRGGKDAYDARLRSESVLEAAEKAAARQAQPALPPLATAERADAAEPAGAAEPAEGADPAEGAVPAEATVATAGASAITSPAPSTAQASSAGPAPSSVPCDGAG